MSRNRDLNAKSLVLFSVFRLLQALCWSPQCWSHRDRFKQTDHMLFLGCKFPKLLPRPALQPHAGIRSVFAAIIRHLNTSSIRSEYKIRTALGSESSSKNITWPWASGAFDSEAAPPNLFKAYGVCQNSADFMFRGVCFMEDCV